MNTFVYYIFWCYNIYYDWIIVYVYLLLQYKDYTLEIVQKLLEPPNGFDATTTNVVFWLCIVLHTVCLYHLGSLCCVHTVVFNKFFFYHHFFVVVPWKKNEYSRYTLFYIVAASILLHLFPSQCTVHITLNYFNLLYSFSQLKLLIQIYKSTFNHLQRFVLLA